MLFKLGVCSLILPLRVAQQLIWLDVPLMIGASCLGLIVGLDGSISRVDGMILFSGAVLYTIFAIKQGRRESTAVEQKCTDEFSARNNTKPWPMQLISIVAGLTMLVFGARWLVEGAITLAKLLGISKLVIGLTIVAAGTSLPEVATSVVASIRGERDIAVANVVGSNLFNILALLGLSSIAAPDGINVAQAPLTFDIPVMIAMALSCAPIFFTSHVIERWEGGVFLTYYCAYSAYLILNSKAHDACPLSVRS